MQRASTNKGGQNVTNLSPGYNDILVTDFEHPYLDYYRIPGTTIGHEHTFVSATSDFLKSLEHSQKPVRPYFRDALETQYVSDYIQTQEARHAKYSFKSEYLAMLKAHEVEYDERYIWD